ASLLTVPAAGNHEHHDREVDGRETYQLAAHWPAQFPLPRNGASGLPHTTYSFDYQGVRFIVLDSTSALKSGSAATQAAWLEPLLEHNPHRWTVVVFHHPVFSASLDRDNSHLREHWAPLFERYGESRPRAARPRSCLCARARTVRCRDTRSRHEAACIRGVCRGAKAVSCVGRGAKRDGPPR